MATQEEILSKANEVTTSVVGNDSGGLLNAEQANRFIDFVVDQLFQTGQCITTDHIAFEYKISMRQLENFITKVLDRIEKASHGSIKAEFNIQKVNDIYVVHFKTKKVEKPT